MEFHSKSAAETKKLAESLDDKLLPGDILALYGDLGSGKTTFVQGLLSSLGVLKNVTSPTFVIVKSYSPKDQRFSKIYHVDSYRLGSKEDAESVGLLELLSQNDNLVLIEWPEKIENILPPKTKKIYFSYVNHEERKISSDDY